MIPDNLFVTFSIFFCFAKGVLSGNIFRRRRVMKKRLCFSSVFLFLCWASLAQGIEAIPVAEIWDLNKCVTMALAHHPDLKSAQGKVYVADSRIGQVKSKLKPQVDIATGYTRQDSSSTRDREIYSSSAGASQLISDGGKTDVEIEVSSLQKESAFYTLKETELLIVYNVKKSYFDLLEAQKNVEVAEETLRLYQLLLDQAQGFYSVGSVSKYDVTTADVDLSKAQLGVITAKTAVKKAKTALDNAMGITTPIDYSLQDIVSTQEVSLNLEEIQKRAFSSRPELQAKKTDSMAAYQNIRLAAKENSPELKASGKYTVGGSSFTEDDNWSMGMTVQFPLYDGGLQTEKIKQAKVELEIAESEVESLRSDVQKEVEQSYLEFTDSFDVLKVAEKVVSQSEENLDIAQNRYRVGVGSPIEVADATEKYKEARKEYWAALYDHWRAWTALEKAVGGSLE